MNEWFYKATPKKTSYQATKALAEVNRFLCRSAYYPSGARASNTKHVKLGDIINFYFKDRNGPQTIGRFEVVGPNKHPNPLWFGASVKETALFEVSDADFEKQLQLLGGDEGYLPDPVLKKMTGWILFPCKDRAAPKFDTALLGGRPTLVRA